MKAGIAAVVAPVVVMGAVKRPSKWFTGEIVDAEVVSRPLTVADIRKARERAIKHG
jgi:hypothetical protein